MSAVSINVHAWQMDADGIRAPLAVGNEYAPILLVIGSATVHLPREHAVRVVDVLTAALAQLKAAHDFHRGAGGAG